MQKPTGVIERLIIKSLTGDLSFSEEKELNEWLSQSEANEVLYRLYTNDYQAGEQEEIESLSSDRGWKLVNDKIAENEQVNAKRKGTMRLLKYAVAACIVIIAGTGVYLAQKAQKDKGHLNVAVNTNTEPNVLPGGNKALLKLSDGSVIVLDSAANGSLAQQGNTKITKPGSGLIAYNATLEKPNEVLYNTLVTPMGGQYKIVLPDGSRVWLNAASSLRFPAAFIGKERTVELTGEGYFEVAKNAVMPFHVRVNNMDVQVLGTHFNVNAYNNEAAIKTTLLEGSVKVTNGNKSGLLRPGQQSQVNKSGNITIVKDADTEQAVAWKNGSFQFNRDEIESVMRQLQRWYDIEIVYEGKKTTDVFSGSISRYTNISNVLKMLELSGVHFKAEGRKITVSDK